MSFGTIGLLGIGEMGSAVARTLGVHTQVVTTLEGRSARTRTNAEAAGVKDVGSVDEMVRQSDLVLSVLASDTAPFVAGSGGGRGPSCGCPAAVRRVQRHRTGHGAGDRGRGRRRDGRRRWGHRRRALATSAGRASTFQGRARRRWPRCGEYGINTVLLGPIVGQASGAKLCHAGMTKGVSTLALDILLAAEALGVADTVMAQYTRSMAGVLQFVDRFVPGNPKRAYRRGGGDAGGRKDARCAGARREHPPRGVRAGCSGSARWSWTRTGRPRPRTWRRASLSRRGRRLGMVGP